MKNKSTFLISMLTLILIFSLRALSQSPVFTYQGKLSDTGTPPTGTYQMEFRLFDAPVGGQQIGSLITDSSVSVIGGVFTVNLNFGATSFPGADRFLQISLRRNAGESFVTLNPRQQIASSPYSIRTLSAASADVATNAQQLGGIPAAQYLQTNGDGSGLTNISAASIATGTLSNSRLGQIPTENIAENAVTTSKLADGNVTDAKIVSVAGSKVTGTVASATNALSLDGDPASSYLQTTSNLSATNITTGTLNNSRLGQIPTANIADSAVTAPKIASGQIVKSLNTLKDDVTLAAGTNITITPAGNTLTIASTGAANSILNQTTPQAGANFNIGGTGTANFFNAATHFNIGGQRVLSVAGTNNTFTGVNAGTATTAADNSFFGAGAGQNNMSAENSFFGSSAGKANTIGNANAFFGYVAGTRNTIGCCNAFFGFNAGGGNENGSGNSFFGIGAGNINETGNDNTFVGRSAGETNRHGSLNTIIGAHADITSNNQTNVTVVGARAQASCSNCMILGSINNVNFANADTNVAIGTTLPAARFHVAGASSAVTTPIAIIQSSGTQAPLAFRIDSTELARIRTNDVGNLVFATVSGTDKDILFRAGDDAISDMFIDSATGNVGIGTASPDDKLDVNGDIRVGTGFTGCVRDRDGTVLTGACSSDLRFKKSVTSFGSVLRNFTKLRPVHFYWRSDEFKDKHFGTRQSYGLVAQDVETVFPDLVTTDEQGFRVVNYSKLPLITIKAVTEQQAQIESQQEQIAALAKQNQLQQSHIEQQRKQIESLTKLFCARNSKTDLCRK